MCVSVILERSEGSSKVDKSATYTVYKILHVQNDKLYHYLSNNLKLLNITIYDKKRIDK